MTLKPPRPEAENKPTVPFRKTQAMRIRTFILTASALVAIGFFGVSYYSISHILDHVIRENARSASDALARTAFAGMYEAMSAGWSRQQLEKHLASVHAAAAVNGASVRFYRGPVVEKQYGVIPQPALDVGLRDVFASARSRTESPAAGVRHLMPLQADARCLTCHTQARIGEVLGVVEVRQDFTGQLAQAQERFLLWLLALAPLAMAGAAFVVWRVNRRLEQSIDLVNDAVAGIGTVSDLRHIEFQRRDLGFEELNRLFAHLAELVEKLRAVAVDKDVLRFEIGLLEKFVITSEVVHDWGDYIARLLAEINTIMPTHVLFSVFQVGDEVFDLEIFWSRPPAAATREMMEHHVRAVVAADARLSGLAQVTLHHHEPATDGDEKLVLDYRSVVLETKALILDRPKIGGIVGIGVHASAVDDDTLRLVMDSILSTMLNVVGSVKAIHKYTHDMEYYATRDPLTDLYNRRVFWELFEHEVAHAQRKGNSFALLVIDLDNFKLVNDTYGPIAGDQYLQAFAHTAQQALRPGDIFARYGGDEFVVMLPDVMLNTAAAVAQRMLEVVKTMQIPAPGAGLGNITGSISIGLAVYPLHSDNAKDLFLFADTMMFKAKNGGKNQIGAPSEEEVAAVFRDMTETTMQVVNAVKEGRIEPFFQPIMDLTSGVVIGHEVLSRLAQQDQQDHHLEASRFIEFAEKAGVIHELDAQVMGKALHKATAHDHDGLLFLNLSPRALSLASFMDNLRRQVDESGIAPGRIVFEITERDTLKSLATLERLVAELKLSGFKLAIDDFGSGFSSFQYLRRLPVDFVKIEGDFVANMLENEKDRAFVQTIRQLAANLGIRVIAEHVESREVAELLRDMGVELGQGYHIGRPQKDGSW